MNRAVAPLPPTSQHTIGPFFPATFFRPGDNDLTRIAADAAPTTRGETLLLRGTITREGGEACVNMIVEAWQADAAGRFRHPRDPGWREADPDFCGWGRAATDAEGRYEFRTVRPGGYAEAGGQRAPHINLTVMGAGLMRRVTTTLYFPGEAANAQDAVLLLLPPERRGRLMAAAAGEAAGVKLLRFDIRLRGTPEEETPFFVE
jgi:protocatechuate 3,4-dioxygenase alpha subunit